MVDIRFFPFCQRCLGLAEVLFFSPFLSFMSSLTFCSLALNISLHLTISFSPFSLSPSVSFVPHPPPPLPPPPPPPPLPPSSSSLSSTHILVQSAPLSPPSPLPAESPYLSAVCLTYLSLLWNIKESAASSPEGSPRLLLTTHTHIHTQLKSSCLLETLCSGTLWTNCSFSPGSCGLTGSIGKL